jgi:hypothetical protein
MFAAQDKKAEQDRIVEYLAKESNAPIEEVAKLYETERAALAIGARITNYLPIFAIRNVLEKLSQRRSLPKALPA